jgi:predicted nicotinamide N-methyase
MEPSRPIRRNDARTVQTRGLTLLKAAHPEIRRLKRESEPTIHGNKVWNSSFLIMDHLTREGFPRGARLMDIGCGWGPLAIFAAKRFGARVIAVDADAEVFPYLELHAAINDVEVETMTRRFERLRKKDLEGIHTLAGADVCFWDELTPVQFNMIRRAWKAGVQRIIIADPGRDPFYNLVERCREHFPVRLLDRRTSTPRPASADLLVIERD